MDWELVAAIGLGILAGAIFTRIFDWALGVLSGKK